MNFHVRILVKFCHFDIFRKNLNLYVKVLNKIALKNNKKRLTTRLLDCTYNLQYGHIKYSYLCIGYNSFY